MKSKTLRIFIIVIVFISIVPIYRILSIYNSDSSSPKSYSSIEDFETETDVSVYQFYDLEEYIINNNKIPLKQTTSYISIYLVSNDKKETSYRIDTNKNNYFYSYNMHNLPFTDYIDSTEKIELKNGTLYLEIYEEYEKKTFSGTFVKNDYYYDVVFQNDDLDDSTGKNKLINYVKLVEDIQ